MTARRRGLALMVAVCAALAAIVAIEAVVVHVRIDLGFALPLARDPAQDIVGRLLQRGASQSPLVIAVEGASRERLGELSDGLNAALRASGRFAYVFNGASNVPDQSLMAVFDWRYLLNPAVAADAFSVANLRERIVASLASLAGVDGMALRALFPRDPTGRAIEVANAWRAGLGGGSGAGTWFSADGASALLVAAPLEPVVSVEQADALLAVVQSSFQSVSPGAARLVVSGPVVFTVESATVVKREMLWLSLISAAAITLVILLTYRSMPVLVLVALPGAFGVAAGTAAVQVVYGEIHGITLAFGAIVLGIAIDYPIHMLSHTGRGRALRDSAPLVWRTVLLGVATTAAAFVPMTVSDFPGLAQLGVFAIAGILVAGPLSRWLLPAVLPNYQAPPAGAAWSRLQPVGAMRARLAIAAVIVAAAAIGIAAAPSPWQDDLLSLSPTPRAQLALDARLRADLPGGDLRYLLAVRGDSAEMVLQRLESLQPEFDRLVATGVVAGFNTATLYLPSEAVQRRRQAALPAADQLQPAVTAATAGLPLRADALAPFVNDVGQSKQRAPVSVRDLSAASLGWLVDSLLFQDAYGWVGLAVPRGVMHPETLAAFAAANADVAFADLRHETEQIVATLRVDALRWLLWGSGIGMAVLLAAVRDPRLVVRTALPVVASLTVTIALLLALGERLTLFHVLALILIAGLAIDYGLMLRLHSESLDEWGQSLRGVALSALTTTIPFAVLAGSAVPVLHQIGLTVAVGTMLSLFFAYFLYGRRTS